MAATEVRPRRREPRVELEALLIEVPRARQPVVGARELVAPGGRARRRAGCAAHRVIDRRRPVSGSESASTTPARDVILHPEQIAERRLHGVRGQQRSARRLDELRRRAQLIAGAQQRAHDHAVDVGFGGQRLEVGRFAGEARGRRARSHDQRSDARQRRRDRVRQAERQEVGLGIRPQDAKGQHDDARERARHRARVVAVEAPNAAQLFGHRVGGRRPFRRPLRQRAPDDAVHRRHGGGAGERRRLFGQRRVEDLDDRCGRRTPAGRPASRTGSRRPRRDRCAHRPVRRSPARAPCSAASRSRCRCV